MWSVQHGTNTTEIGTAIDAIDEHAALVLIFASPSHDLEELAQRCRLRWGNRVIGCTTAGEIGSLGYGSGGVVVAAFAQNTVVSETVVLEDLVNLDQQILEEWRERCLAHRLNAIRQGVALLLCDGLCLREEHLAAQIRSFLPDCPLIGGSAGDDLNFRKTQVFGNGIFASGRAALTWIGSKHLAFEPIQLQDFSPIGEDMVITAAKAEHRLILEIDGENALDVYARTINRRPGDLTLHDFAMHSLMLTIGGQTFIRSVRDATKGGALVMHSAIDEGMLVQIGRSENALPSFTACVEQAMACKGHLGLLAFDCIHRRLELDRLGGVETASRMAIAGSMAGFITYGEITDGLHVNQTCTGMHIRLRTP